MNIRRKRVIIPVTATVVALGVAGGVWATAANASDVTGADRDRVAAAAVLTVPGGTVTDVETSDDPGEAYEVEIRKPDGSEVDLVLDQNLKVISQEADTPDGPDADDRVLPDAERATAEKAALAAVPGGTVTSVEASDDPGVAYEVDVRDATGAEWDLDLDTTGKVLSKTADN